MDVKNEHGPASLAEGECRHKKYAGSFVRRVEENSPRSEFAQLIPGLLRMGQMFADQKTLQAGDTFTVDWIAGTGTVVTVKGVAQGEPIKEQAFFNALLRIWLGPAPADYKLKVALLGIKG